jgi:hypothetical protein
VLLTTIQDLDSGVDFRFEARRRLEGGNGGVSRWRSQWRVGCVMQR